MDNVILIVIAFFAGVGVTLIACHSFGKRLMRVARMISEAPRSTAVPSFEIPIELDKDRIVEVGYAQALREEAQRIGRLN